MNEHQLTGLAARFAVDAAIADIKPLGGGNVNATFCVSTARATKYVLQRLNTGVFDKPQLVMANLRAISEHAMPRLRDQGVASHRSPWQWCCSVPLMASCVDDRPSNESSDLLQVDGEFWRMLTYINDAHAPSVLVSTHQAHEIGRGLGFFHALVHDLPADCLADTLEGFHITPLYYSKYLELLRSRPDRALNHAMNYCIQFIASRRELVSVLEDARACGRLRLQPIHGDPKVNNVMLCNRTGCAVAMVDLDTVKPGLLHYDIGDALRSGCNPAGEEATSLDEVVFDLEMAEAMLSGYLGEARHFLREIDIFYLYDAIRLLPFELGLRFFSDYLAGNTYFTVEHPRQNLDRALVQFKLVLSIESQEVELRALLSSLCPR